MKEGIYSAHSFSLKTGENEYKGNFAELENYDWFKSLGESDMTRFALSLAKLAAYQFEDGFWLSSNDGGESFVGVYHGKPYKYDAATGSVTLMAVGGQAVDDEKQVCVLKDELFYVSKDTPANPFFNMPESSSTIVYKLKS